jgi:photosystem II stability/assembly factor-like uncharacterized protein
MKMIFKIFVLSFFIVSILHGQSNFWAATNGPYGSYAFSIATSPNGHLFLATNQGVYRSTNKGTDWALLPNSQSATFQNVIVLPDSVIFCGFMSEHQNAEYFSTDDGLTWQDTHLSSTSKSLTMTSSGAILAGPDGGVFRSTNFGSSWSLVLSSRSVYCMVSRGNYIFASTWEGFFKSIDDGLTWIKYQDTVFQYLINAIGFDQKGNIFASGFHTYYSEDNGDHWRNISDVVGGSIAFDSLGNIYLGSDHLYVSRDHGLSWVTSDSGLPSIGITGIVCDKENNIYVSISNEGVFRSTNSGVTWQKINNYLKDISVTSILALSEDSILVGSTSGVFCSSDQGNHWTQVIPANLYDSYSILKKSSNGYIFTGTYPKGIFSSSDRGNTWINCKPYFSYPLAMVIDNRNYVFVGSWQDGIIVSKDNGHSWQHVGMDSIWIESGTLAIDGTIFWGTNQNGIYSQSADGTIRQVANVPEVISMTCSSSGVLFAGTYGSGIFRSTDNGKSWSNVNNNSPARFIYSLLTDRLNNVYASTFNYGVIHSSNNGDSWEQYFSGLGGTEYYSLAISPQGRLYVGSNSGLFRSTSKINLPPEPFVALTTPLLLQNYPNPFNSESTIVFYIPSDAFVTIKVYDIQGREIKTLVNSQFKSGTYTTILNSEELPSGVYFYKLLSGSFSSAKKIVVLK